MKLKYFRVADEHFEKIVMEHAEGCGFQHLWRNSITACRFSPVLGLTFCRKKLSRAVTWTEGTICEIEILNCIC